MKYPQSVAMPRDVEDWLEEELEARGIDSVVYTKYILGLMLQDSFDLDLCASGSFAHPYNKGVRSGQPREGSCPSWDQYELKRLAVIRCLMSATGKTRGIESLVDQLYTKLQFIQSDDNSEASNTLQTTDYLPHFDYTLRPFNKAMDDWKAVAQPNSAMTRGILRASLQENDTAIPHDDLSPVEYFPLTRSNTMYSNTLDIYGPRLYERSANRSLERVMAGLDATFHQFWNPQDAPQQLHTTATNQNNHSFFQHDSKPTPPANYVNSSMFDSALGPPVPWSLGESQACNLLPSEECVDEVELIEDSVHSNSPQEDLLTSDRTHFRPIHPSKQTNEKNVYQNGTTFAITNDLQNLKFQRSESGTLFLDSGKYMEYKMNSDDELGDEEFVPKFRVLQSNEKFCQTDDADALTVFDEDSSITSSLELEQGDFYFPGDDFLALDSGSDDHPECGEVAGIVTGYLNFRLVASSWDEEPMWDAQEEAMVHDLVKSPTGGYLSCTAADYVKMEDAFDVAPSTVGLNDSVWTPMMSTQSCERCRGGVAEENKKSFAILSKDLKIWEQSVCQSCSQPNKLEDSWVKQNAEDKDSWKWIKLGATLSALLRAHHDGVQVVHLSEHAFSASIEEVSEEALREHKSPCADDVSLREAIMAVEAQNSQEDTVPDPFTYYLLKDELCKDGNQLLSDLRGLQLDQIDTATDIGVLNAERRDSFIAEMPSSLPDKNPSFVSMWASWNVIAIDEDDANFDERTYDFAGAQKEKRRRHSSSQKMWEQPMRGESRRAHSRFRQYTSPRVHESVCVSALGPRLSRDVHRSFTV